MKLKFWFLMIYTEAYQNLLKKMRMTHESTLFLVPDPMELESNQSNM